MKHFIKSTFTGIFIGLGFFITAFFFIKAANLTATNGTPLTASNWNDMVSNFFWGSGSGGIYYNGKVGIGINAPNKNLHIYDTTNNAEIDLQSVAGTNKHWAIYQDKTNSNLYIWSNQNNVAISTGGNMDVLGKVNGIGGICMNGDCKTAWSQVGSSISTNYTGTCDSAHKGSTGIISGVFKVCNGLIWYDIAAAQNYFAGVGSSVDPYRLNGESTIATTVTATSCNYYNINANSNNVGGSRLSGTCGNGTQGCLSSGVYRIDPDGAGGTNAFNVYCDMTNDTGGWTMCYAGQNQKKGTSLADGLNYLSTTWTYGSNGNYIFWDGTQVSNFGNFCNLLSVSKIYSSVYNGASTLYFKTNPVSANSNTFSADSKNIYSNGSNYIGIWNKSSMSISLYIGATCAEYNNGSTQGSSICIGNGTYYQTQLGNINAGSVGDWMCSASNICGQSTTMTITLFVK